MAPPQFTDDHPENVFLRRTADGRFFPSEGAIELIRNSRANYVWPFNITAAESQQEIIDVESDVGEWANALTIETAHRIVVRVSQWAGNRRHRMVAGVTVREKALMYEGVRNLLYGGDLSTGLEMLSDSPGISLVIATKVFRFCMPNSGAAVDRHASYFFNSLCVKSENASVKRSTSFNREWTNGDRSQSRLATFNHRGFSTNLNEYTRNYLPLLREIASALNVAQIQVMCAATGLTRIWAPADIEMAAFFWWAQNGSR